MEIGTDPANGFENTQKRKTNLIHISEMEKGVVTVDLKTLNGEKPI